MRVNFLGLQAFLSVAERGSFRRAAGHLNLSQTAISHRIKKLEDELGMKLFNRTSREVSLTKAALELMQRAKAAVTELEASFDEVRRQGMSRNVRLSIACLPAFALYRLPRVLARFKDVHPNVDIRINEASSPDIADLLIRDEAEFGLSVVSINRWDLEVEPLIKSDPMVLACPSHHELARRKSVRWSNLKGVPLIRIGNRTSVRPLIDDALGAMRDQLDWQYEVQCVETAVGLAEAGCALTVVPRSNVELLGSKRLVGRLIKGPVITCAFGLVTKRGVPLSPIAEIFRDLLREQTAEEERRTFTTLSRMSTARSQA